MRSTKRGYLTPATISLGYVVISSLWILGSDFIAYNLQVDGLTPAFIQHIKGLLFVVVTGLLLYLVLDRYRGRIVNREEEINSLSSELHHRVKNNMALVTSLLDLERSNRDFDERYDALLEDTIYKIKTIAIIHELQYGQNSFSRIDLNDFLHEFNKRILSSLSHPSELSVELKFAVEETRADIKIAIPTALLIYELVVYAKKYAGAEINGVYLEVDKSKRVLQVACHYEAEGGHPLLDLNDSDTLEIKLTKALLKQLNAVARVESSEKETTVFVEIPLR